MGQRAAAAAAVVTILAVALGIRVLASGGGIFDSSGALAQYSGTVLYAAMIYAGIFVLAPGMRPWLAAALALGFCWAVELLQLTGLPAELSARSTLTRLALGVHFDPADLAWYAAGVLPVAAAHQWLIGRGRPRS